MSRAKRQTVSEALPETPQEPPDPWTCAHCCAPELTAVFRVGRHVCLCWHCFFESSYRTGSFVTRKAVFMSKHEDVAR